VIDSCPDGLQQFPKILVRPLLPPSISLGYQAEWSASGGPRDPLRLHKQWECPTALKFFRKQPLRPGCPRPAARNPEIRPARCRARGRASLLESDASERGRFATASFRDLQAAGGNLLYRVPRASQAWFRSA